MQSIHESRAFTAWTDPQSGVTSYLLDQRVAPQQLTFYFVNSGMTDDGRYIWFYAAFPPAGNERDGRTLGVFDADTGATHHFPDSQFSSGSPMVDPTTGEVYWVSGLEIWKRSPDPDAEAVLVNSIPTELMRDRRPHRIATHLTMSADRRFVNIDGQVGREWFLGAAPLDGGQVEIWQRFDRNHNHAQFSPTDPDLMLIAQDWWHDVVTGEHAYYQDRLWLIRRGEEARPILPDDPSDRRTHEWWGADGRHVWYVDYDRGTERVDVATGERENIWPGGTCHSYCDRSGRYLVGDIGTYSWARTGCRVAFFNTETGREVDIVSVGCMPEPEGGRRRYHVDPHPRFCADDRYICYTTTIHGRADVAIVPVAELIALTS
ncbi:MAG: oligogalacturonate lyase family protein [Chloroflexota bacterium]|nr:oligogalacturonate lyase family protein [Chloroflexota bacterium]